MSRQIVCYDIRDDRRRTRVHKLLNRYGEPVEESVFELDLAPRKLQELRGKLLKLVDRRQDIVRVYPLCERCAGQTDVVVGPPVMALPAAHVV